VVAKVRALRTARAWTQAELAAKLGISQARLSEIERGGGSFTAEQLLEVLRLFNVSIDEFAGPQDVEDELQNALARLGALHLREVDGTLPSARVGGVRAAIRETLLGARDARLLLALAPVLLANLDAINLDVLHDELAQLGFPARVPWLVENVHAALFLTRVAPGRVAARRWHRAVAVLGEFISRHPAFAEGPPRIDHLDAGIRSQQALVQIQSAASDISRSWGVVSDLQPADFADAIRAADVAG
jgi:transcriptional regulator with XRE-family HTH domain